MVSLIFQQNPHIFPMNNGIEQEKKSVYIYHNTKLKACYIAFVTQNILPNRYQYSKKKSKSSKKKCWKCETTECYHCQIFDSFKFYVSNICHLKIYCEINRKRITASLVRIHKSENEGWKSVCWNWIVVRPISSFNITIDDTNMEYM